MKKKFLTTKLNNNVIIYDYETCGRSPYTTEPIEISACCMDINTLELKTDSDGQSLFFSTLVKPPPGTEIQEDALKKNNITLEILEKKGVDQKFAFQQFAGFCRQFAKSDRAWDQPYSAGFNIQNFDNIITDRLCERYGYMDNKGNGLILHPYHCFDLAHILRMYFAWNDDLPSYSLDSIRDYFGIDKTGAHRADKDVIDSYLILKRFISYYKKLAQKTLSKFKDSFKGE